MQTGCRGHDQTHSKARSPGGRRPLGYPETEATDTKHRLCLLKQACLTHIVRSDRMMTTDKLTGSQGSGSASTNTVTLLFLPACCSPPQVSGEEIPKATRPPPSETLGILPSANYLVVSDLVKWN